MKKIFQNVFTWLLIFGFTVSILLNVWFYSRGDHLTAKNNAATYVCPMHPQVVNDRPSDCPICGMKLVKMTNEIKNGTATNQHFIHLSPNEELLANIRTEKPTRIKVETEKRISAILKPKEKRIRKISLPVMYRVETIYASESGTQLKKGDKLVAIYSPDLITAQSEYLLNQSNEILASASLKKLYSLGLDDVHIDQLKEQKKVQDILILYSPIDGVLMDVMTKTGEWVMNGMPILEIADYSQLWVVAYASQNDIRTLRIGKKVQIEANGYFTSSIIEQINPEIDMMSKTVTVRATLDNPSLNWLPQQFVTMVIQETSQEELLSVPEESVLRTGMYNRVWVKEENGKYYPRDVKIGPVVKGRIVVLDGLTEDDQVAVSGAYLLDSESKLTLMGQSSSNIFSTKSSSNESTSSQLSRLNPTATPAKYICPMNCPNSESDKPGKCPVCGMNLELNEANHD